MGSTTKIWTLDLAAQALADHFVSLNDLVTINADEASHLPPNESSMTDVNSKPLEKGEVVKFGDLLRGMMYPSGNNAATPRNWPRSSSTGCRTRSSRRSSASKAPIRR